jgi:hypothetical protein
MIAHYSSDEVNRHLVRRWAAAAGVRAVAPAVGRPGAPDRSVRGVILDLDFLPHPYRAEWVGRVLAGECRSPVLVHWHGIADTEAAALRRAGARVVRGRLKASAFARWLGDAAVRATGVGRARPRCGRPAAV